MSRESEIKLAIALVEVLTMVDLLEASVYQFTGPIPDLDRFRKRARESIEEWQEMKQ